MSFLDSSNPFYPSLNLPLIIILIDSEMQDPFKAFNRVSMPEPKIVMADGEKDA